MGPPRFAAALAVLLVGCAAPPEDAPLCFEGTPLAYVAVFDDAASGFGPAIDAVAVTDVDGAVHWATQQFEGSYVAMTGEPDPAAMFGEPDASCESGYVHLAAKGVTIVGFEFATPIFAETVSVYTADGCGHESAYRVVTTIDDRDESWTPIASATGSSTLALPSGCDEPRDPGVGSAF